MIPHEYRGLVHDMEGLANKSWEDTASWQARKSSNCAKSPRRVWTITNSKMKDWRQLENGQKFVHTSS